MTYEQYDAVIIGSGQAGNPLALAAAKHGWRTALVERRFVGGVCTNDGCTPTKTMIASARVAALARRGAEYGVACGEVAVDLKVVKERTQQLVLKGRGSIQRSLQEQQGVDLIFGEASFAVDQPAAGQGQHHVGVKLNDGTSRHLASARIFIDTGERPHLPSIRGLEATPFFDSTSILQLETVPAHLLILGGGYIALEFAQMFRRFGSAVTIVERGDQLIEHDDAEIAACMTSILGEDGVDILLQTETTQVSGEPGSITLETQGKAGARNLHGSHLLVATGRTPNVEALHTERVGLRLAAKGYIDVNDRLETSVPGIWALGDVTGGPAYTHIAYDDFRIVRANLLEGGARSTRDRLVPYCIFTDPELGRVGLSEKQAREQGHDPRVFTMPMSKVARASESAETRGMMQAVVDRASGRLLGAAVLGLGGGDVVTELEIAMAGGLTADDLQAFIFIHPVLGEGLNVLFKKERND